MNFFHSDRFSVLCYLLASALGIVSGILSISMLGVFNETDPFAIVDLVQVPVVTLTMLLFSLPILLITFVAASLFMIPATIFAISWARKTDRTNLGFAALLGMPIAAIFAIVFATFGTGSMEVNITSVRNPIWAAVLVGGAVGGCGYFWLGQRLNFWANRTENPS